MRKNSFFLLFTCKSQFSYWVPKYPWSQSVTAQLPLHMLLLKAKTCWNNHSQCLKRMCFRHCLMHLVSSGSMKSQHKTAATSKMQGWCGFLLSPLPSLPQSLAMWRTTKNCLHHKPLFQGKWLDWCSYIIAHAGYESCKFLIWGWKKDNTGSMV